MDVQFSSIHVPATLLPLDADGVMCLSQAATFHERPHITPTHPGGSMDSMTEQTHGDRVREIEDQLGLSTSDAQAMVEAEDLLASRASKNAAQHHGPHA